jgi:hypothetical protein
MIAPNQEIEMTIERPKCFTNKDQPTQINMKSTFYSYADDKFAILMELDQISP